MITSITSFLNVYEFTFRPIFRVSEPFLPENNLTEQKMNEHNLEDIPDRIAWEII